MSSCDGFCDPNDVKLQPTQKRNNSVLGQFHYSEQNSTAPTSLKKFKLVDSADLDDPLDSRVNCTIGDQRYDYTTPDSRDPPNTNGTRNAASNSFIFPSCPALSMGEIHSTLFCNITLTAGANNSVNSLCVCLDLHRGELNASCPLSSIPSATQPGSSATNPVEAPPKTLTSTLKRKRDGEIAGGVIGGVVILLVMFILWRRCRKSRETSILHREKTMERRSTRQSSLWSFLPPTPSMLAEAAKFDPTRMVKTGSPFDKKAFLANNPVGEVRSLLPQP